MEESRKVFFPLDEIPEGAVGDIVRIGNQRLFRIRNGNASLVSEPDWECSKCHIKWFKSKLYQTEQHCPNSSCGKWAGFLQNDKEKV